MNTQVELVMVGYCVADLSLCLFFTQGHWALPWVSLQFLCSLCPLISQPGTTPHPPTHFWDCALCGFQHFIVKQVLSRLIGRGNGQERGVLLLLLFLKGLFAPISKINRRYWQGAELDRCPWVPGQACPSAGSQGSLVRFQKQEGRATSSSSSF